MKGAGDKQNGGHQPDGRRGCEYCLKRQNKQNAHRGIFDKVAVRADTAAQHQIIAVAKGNADLLSEIDAALKKLGQRGAYKKIYQKWFGNESDLPTP